MAKSLAQALVEAGRVRPEDTPEARREAEWRARQRADAEALAARMDAPPSRTPWEPPATGRIVEPEQARPVSEPRPCGECGEPFDPTAAEHKRVGRSDLCGACAEVDGAGPRRKRGQMIWTHKTAPVLEIEGAKTLGPEELAAMRRR